MVCKLLQLSGGYLSMPINIYNISPLSLRVTSQYFPEYFPEKPIKQDLRIQVLF